MKLQIPGGQATPAPPVGPALGQHGVNIMEFCKQFNARTQQAQGIVTPVLLTVYSLAVYLYHYRNLLRGTPATPPRADGP